MPRSSPVLLLVAALLAAPSTGEGGCLAPSDTTIDVGLGSGPLSGNDAGSLFYARQGLSGHPTLVLRTPDGAKEDVAVEADPNEFYVGLLRERWDVFYSGTVNATDDLAFVAATKLPDDPQTPQNEATSRRGVYARSGRTMYEVARYGNASPIRDVFNVPVPWGSLFDAIAADRDTSGFLRVVFSGQVAGTLDHRTGLFRWNEATPNVATPALLAGDSSPSGGSFVSFGRLRGNGPGDAVFFGVTQLTSSSPQVPGLYLLGADGSKARVVKFGTAGDDAPGGGTFGIAGDFDVDDAGVVYFTATIQSGQSGPNPTALFRAKPPNYTPETIVSAGDATPIAGTYGSFAGAAVRANASGEIVVSVPLSDDVGGDGIFSVAPDGTQLQAIVAVPEAIAVAAVGPSRAAYQTEDAVRIVIPSDGSEEGPTDFRITNVDLKNSVPLRSDSIKFEGRLLLPPWGTLPPATFRGDATRFTPSQSLTGAALARIAEVKVSVSASPGNNFILGIAGPDAAPVGSVKFNGQPQTMKKLTISADGSSATWSFTGNPGPGSLNVNLAAGTFRLSVSAATIQPSYDAFNFRVALVLRSEEDVIQARPDDQSYFRQDFRLNAKQPRFGGGRRVTSKGETTPGGTVFVDALKITRSPAKGGKSASDLVQMSGTLRLCPGASAPATPRINATLRLGSFVLDNVSMERVGRTSAYRHAASGVDLRLDLAKATFTLKASSAPLTDLVAPVQGSATNGPERTVGGMHLDFTLSIPRVYEVSYPIAVVRLPGGKVFTR